MAVDCDYWVFLYKVKVHGRTRQEKMDQHLWTASSAGDLLRNRGQREKQILEEGSNFG